MRCNIGRGIYLDWSVKAGPSFLEREEHPSWSMFNVADISLSGGTATFVYESNKFEALAFPAEAGLHFITRPPYDHIQPEFLSIYAYPASPGAPNEFAAVWSAHHNIVDNMPAPQLYYGSCHPVP
jgi:hypothetical protein